MVVRPVARLLDRQLVARSAHAARRGARALRVGFAQKRKREVDGFGARYAATGLALRLRRPAVQALGCRLRRPDGEEQARLFL
jgi:hypothetical protein